MLINHHFAAKKTTISKHHHKPRGTIKCNMGDFITALDMRDEQSYNLLFKKLYKPLCFFAFKIINDTEKAEDIVQDCFLKLWLKEKSFSLFEKAQSYLYLSVKNACFDDIEHKLVKSKHQKSLLADEFIVNQNILDLIIQSEVLRKVLLAIESLPPKCKEIIKLTYNEGKSTKEIADELGVSISTVTNQKLRSISILKQRLSHAELLAFTLLISAQKTDIQIFKDLI